MEEKNEEKNDAQNNEKPGDPAYDGTYKDFPPLEQAIQAPASLPPINVIDQEVPVNRAELSNETARGPAYDINDEMPDLDMPDLEEMIQEPAYAPHIENTPCFFNVTDLEIPVNHDDDLVGATELEDWPELFRQSLYLADYEMSDLISLERELHSTVLELRHATFFSESTLEACGSVLSNCLSYHNMASLCCERALETFSLTSANWGVKVGFPCTDSAILLTCSAIVPRLETIIVVHLCKEPDILANSFKRLFESHYRVICYILHKDDDLLTGDYRQLENLIGKTEPKMVICSSVIFPILHDFNQIKEICYRWNCDMMVDISNFSSTLFCGSLTSESPFGCANYVITDCRTFGGPSCALLFFKKEAKNLYGKKCNVEINVEGCSLAALSVSLHNACSASFLRYPQKGIDCAISFAQELRSRGYKVVTGSIQLVLLLIEKEEVASVDTFLRACNIYTLPAHCGLVFSTLPLTARGIRTSDFLKIAEVVHLAVQHALRIRRTIQPLEVAITDYQAIIEEIKLEVEDIAKNCLV